jgi:hypothetical protein
MINFCAIYRNNFSYLNNFLIPTITKLDKFEFFNFYFYTNDSTDGTEELLVNLSAKYKNITTLVKQVGNKHFEGGWELERIQGLAHARNNLLTLRPFANHQWSVFVDSNIYFHPDIFDKFLHFKKPDSGVVFACAGLDFRFPCYLHENCFCYYDLLGVIDSKGRQGFELLKELNFVRTCSFPFLDQSEEYQYNLNLPVRVQSAFGGMCFYKTNVINQSDVYYSSNIQKWHPNENIPIYLEHWDFHQRVSNYGDLYTIPLKVYRDELYQICKPI